MSSNVYQFDPNKQYNILNQEDTVYDAIDFGDYEAKEFTFALADEDDTLIIVHSAGNNEIIGIGNWSTKPITTFIFGTGDNQVNYNVEILNATNSTGAVYSYINLVNSANAYKRYAVADTTKAQVIQETGLKKNLLTTGSANDKITLLESTYNKVATCAGEDTVIVIGGSKNIVNGEANNDVVTAIAGTSNTVSGGAANDVLRVFSTKSNILQGGDGDDILTTYGGNCNLLVGNKGTDTYKIMTALTEGTVITVNQVDASVNDRDRLILAKESKQNIFWNVVGNDLQIVNKTTGGMVVVQNWCNSPLQKVIFQDGVMSLAEIVDESGVGSLTSNVVTYVGTEAITGIKGNTMFKSVTYEGDTITSTVLENVLVDTKGGQLLDIVNGAYAPDGGDVTDNSVTLTKIVASLVRGGYTNNGSGNNNIVTVTDSYIGVGTYADNENFGVFGAVASDEANDNEVSVTNGQVAEAVGARGNKGVSGNKLTLYNTTVESYAIGGRTDAADAINNTVETLYTTAKEIYGGRVETTAVTGCKTDSNTVTMGRDNVELVFGGYIYLGNATNNKVSINTGSVTTVCGGYVRTEGDARSNKVMLYNGVEAETIYGGLVKNSGAANGNYVLLSSGSQVNDVYGGSAGSDGAAFNNTVNVRNNSTVINIVIGGYSASGIAYQNEVTIKDSTAEVVVGGYSSSGNAHDNTIYISNSTVQSAWGGFSSSGSVFDNTVNISGTSTVGSVYGGNGKDIINVKDTSVVTGIYSGAGDDEITVDGGSVTTISGGVGDDVIEIKNVLASNVEFIIDQSTAESTDRDKLVLSNVSKNNVTYALDGEDLLINDAGGGHIRIRDWTSKHVATIAYKDGEVAAKDIAKSVGKLTELDVIQLFMSALDNTTQRGFAAVDEAVAYCSSGYYANLSSLINDYKDNVLTYSGITLEAVEGFLKEYCGINLENTDTGAITGADAGGSIVKTAESIVPEPEDMTIADFAYDYYTIEAGDIYGYISGQDTKIQTKEFYAADVKGVTFYWDESNWDSLGTDKNILKQIIGGIINSWGEAALKLGEETYGLTLDATNSTLKELSNGKKGMQICLTNEQNANYVAKVMNIPHYDTNNPSVTVLNEEILIINTAFYQDAITDVNGNSSGNSTLGTTTIYLDRNIAHELVHALMVSNINRHGALPLFIREGLAELVHGVDDSRKSEILKFAYTGYSATWKNTDGTYITYDLEGLIDAVFNQNDSTAHIGNETYAGGYILLRYLAKQVSENIGAELEVADLGEDAISNNNLSSAASNNLESSFKSVAEASLTFADNALAATSFATEEENKEQKLQISGNIA